MANVAPINHTKSLPNPNRPGNRVPPSFQAGRDGPLVEFERVLDDAHPAHANRTLTEIGRAVPDVRNFDQVITRLLERGLVSVSRRGRYDFTPPLFCADLRHRPDGNDHVKWPHCDHQNWPHPRPLN